MVEWWISHARKRRYGGSTCAVQGGQKVAGFARAGRAEDRFRPGKTLSRALSRSPPAPGQASDTKSHLSQPRALGIRRHGSSRYLLLVQACDRGCVWHKSRDIYSELGRRSPLPFGETGVGGRVARRAASRVEDCAITETQSMVDARHLVRLVSSGRRSSDDRPSSFESMDNTCTTSLHPS
jgi:hypothetical protein